MSSQAHGWVTDEHVRAYGRDGVVHLPGVLDDAGIRACRRAFQAAMEEPGPHAEYIGKGVTWNTLFEVGAPAREVEMFQDQLFFEEAKARVPAWAEIVQSSPAAAIIARLMESRSAAFFYAHLILKHAGAESEVPWHQDLPYWKVEGRQIGSVWLALDDMPAAASVRYLRGSHRWGLFRPRHFVDASPYTGRGDLPLLPDVDATRTLEWTSQGRGDLPLLPDVDATLAGRRAEALAFEVRAGDAVCFDARIVHGSPGNPEERAGRSHRRVALRFCGDDATFCDRPGESAIPTPEVDAVHGLRHGDRIVCKAFPIVWPRL